MIGSPTAAAAKPPFDAVIFDLDGVVTNTALVHQAAWKDAFDRILHDPRVPADARHDEPEELKPMAFYRQLGVIPPKPGRS